MPIKVRDKWITIKDCRDAPDEYFIFGDNVERWGKGGQAIIRDEPNAIGIPTKKSPSEYFTDEDSVYDNIVPDLKKIVLLLDAGKTVWFPKDGIGTGLAKLKETAPQLYDSLYFLIDLCFHNHGDVEEWQPVYEVLK